MSNVLRAVMSDGRVVVLHHRYGDTPEDLEAVLTADTLTGSAMPLARATLQTEDGEHVAYADINTFEFGR